MTNRAGKRILLSRSYDTNSGLVFDETVVPANLHRGCLVCHEPSPSLQRQHHSKSNAPSLKSSALRAIVSFSASLTSKELRSLPAHLLKEVWAALRVRGTKTSLRLWLAFANACDNEPWLKHEFECRCTYPDFAILRSINTTSFVWTTRLELRHTGLQIQDYVRLTELRNVESITLRDLVMGRTRMVKNVFDDRILRSWSEAATARGAFSKLKSLFLEAQPISPNAFVLFNKLPQLEVVGMCYVDWASDKSSKSIAKREGWNALSTPKAILQGMGGTASMWVPEGRCLFSMILEHHHKLCDKLTHEQPLLCLTFDDCAKDAVSKSVGQRALQWYQRDWQHVPEVQQGTTKDAPRSDIRRDSVLKKRKACDLGAVLGAF